MDDVDSPTAVDVPDLDMNALLVDVGPLAAVLVQDHVHLVVVDVDRLPVSKDAVADILVGRDGDHAMSSFNLNIISRDVVEIVEMATLRELGGREVVEMGYT